MSNKNNTTSNNLGRNIVAGFQPIRISVAAAAKSMDELSRQLNRVNSSFFRDYNCKLCGKLISGYWLLPDIREGRNYEHHICFKSIIMKLELPYKSRKDKRPEEGWSGTRITILAGRAGRARYLHLPRAKKRLLAACTRRRDSLYSCLRLG